MQGVMERLGYRPCRYIRGTYQHIPNNLTYVGEDVEGGKEATFYLDKEDNQLYVCLKGYKWHTEWWTITLPTRASMRVYIERLVHYLDNLSG